MTRGAAYDSSCTRLPAGRGRPESVRLDLLLLDPAGDPRATAVLREAAQVTLVVAVIGAAIRLPAGWARRRWRGLAVALGSGMSLTRGAGTLVAALALGLPPPPRLFLGAAVAPTDPVLSAPSSPAGSRRGWCPTTSGTR